MRKKVLWIEDDSFNELPMFATAVHLTGEYDLDYAVDATEAIDKLCEKEYDAVVVDVRLPPGDDPRWIHIFYRLGSSNKAARLGVRLLQNVLGKEKEWIEGLKGAARDWKRYGVLSMDSWDDIRKDLAPCNVTLYRDKGSGENPSVLLQIIREILAQQNGGGDYV